MKINHTNLKSGLLRWMALSAAAAASVLAMGCAQYSASSMNPSAPGGSGSPAPAAQPSAAISVCTQSNGDCTPATSFSLATIRDLVIHVDWINLPAGTRTQTLRFLDPGDGSFQVKNSSFVVTDNGQASADVTFPVKGSMITQRQITGTWKLEVSLDGKPVISRQVILEP
jgi:hypothetical protein